MSPVKPGLRLLTIAESVHIGSDPPVVFRHLGLRIHMAKSKKKETAHLAHPGKPGKASNRVLARTIIRSENFAHTLSGLSMLEVSSVLPSTLTDFLSRVLRLIYWMSHRHLDWTCATELDACLVMYLDWLLVEGYNGEDGNKLLAGMKFFLPEIARLGNLSLPRAARSVKSWLAKRPARQRTPLPWVALCAILGYFLHKNDILTALAFLLQFRTYVRPGVFDAMTVSQLVPPVKTGDAPFSLWGLILYPSEVGIPGKTGTFDDAVLLDSELWLDPFLNLLIANRVPHDLLFAQPGSALVLKLQEAVTALGLGPLKPVRYSLRHGGASDDLLCRRRSLEEVKKRGQWRTDQSLRRYGKETKALAEMHKIPSNILEYGLSVSENLENMFHRNLIAPPPSPRS